MKLHFLTVPIHNSSTAEGELNQFHGSHRVIAVDRQLVSDGARSAWAICVTYVPGDAGTVVEARKKPRLDYRELLPAADFQVFARLRDLRKRLAEREGVPPYALFTNEQLGFPLVGAQTRVRRPAPDPTCPASSLARVGENQIGVEVACGASR